jgi:hypothetical protein
MIYPIPAFPSPKVLAEFDWDWLLERSEYFLKTGRDGSGPNKEYFDLTINQEAFDNIKVTLAPHATESDRIIVECLLEKYTKSGILVKSSLTNLIRPLKR